MGKHGVIITFYESVQETAHQTPPALPDLSFRVLKHFRITKEPRTIRFSRNGIENIKQDIATSVHRYSAIKRLRLENMTHILIEYHSDHDYHYESDNAMEIMQELCTRVAAKLYNLKPDLSAREIPMEYQKHLVQAGAGRGSKLDRLTGTDGSQRVSLAVDKILLDASTEEGRTIQKFVSNYQILEKNHESVGSNLRTFMDGLKEHTVSTYAAELKQLSVSQMDTTAIAVLVELCLERAVLTPLYTKVVTLLDTAPTIRDNDAQLTQVMGILYTKPQSFFEIKYLSTSAYNEAVRELRTLEMINLPQPKLKVILNTAQAIYTLVNSEQNAGKSQGEQKQIYLAADDFLPILIFVIVRAQLTKLSRTCEFLSLLCDPTVLRGEGGYYLTAFSSAVQYLLTLDPKTLDSRSHI
eukprot:TRINITY_DN8293_c0_g1_i1.p1 TRINITY_DN8293_c0_g1~~TRINITY_DN8293_c0_g1_i1.p1  ORF type:complete len:418 (+),score=50.45 TRINITY_DN8293_c0_g1_i1:22-1254(+)